MPLEGVGFGYGKFGNFPFGKADFGEGVVVHAFPEKYVQNKDGSTNEVMQHYLMTIADSVNRVKAQIDDVPEQVDVNAVKDDILRYLGTTIAVQLDDAEPVEFRRSLVNNAVLFYRIKGTEESYRIRGKISGFDVEVFNMYRILPAYIPLFDPENIFELPAGSGDFYTDLPPGSVSGGPSGFGCDYCLTSFIKLGFTVVKEQPASVIGAPNLFDRLVYKLRDIIPIHVRDVLYELRLFIEVDEHQSLSAAMVSSFEDTFTPVMVFPHYDAVVADSIPTDTRGYIQGTVSSETI